MVLQYAKSIEQHPLPLIRSVELLQLHYPDYDGSDQIADGH